MTILDRSSGVFSSVTSFNVTRSTGSYGTGTTIVIIVFGNTVVTTPGGWTQRTNSVVNLGLYSYDKTAAAESSIGFTCSSGSGVWFAWELSAGSTFLTPGSAGQDNVGASSYASGTLTPTAGARHLLVASGGTGTGNARTITSWTNSFTEWADAQATSQDWPFAAGADRNVTANGSTGYSTTATFSGAAIQSAGAALLAYIDSSTVDGTAALASASTLTAAASVVRAGTAALTSTSALSATGQGRPFFRAAASALGTAGTCTLTIPPTVLAGDLMLITAVFKVATGTDTIATPAGWAAQIAPVNGAGASYQTAEFILVATGSSAGSSVVVAGVIPSAQQINAVLAAYGSADVTPRSAALATNGTSASTSVNAASATTVANDLIIYTGGVRGSVNGPAGEPTFTGPGTMRVQSAATSAGAQNVAVFLGDDGDTVGARTITASRSSWSTAGQTILIPSPLSPGSAALASTSALTSTASTVALGAAALASTSALTAAASTTVAGTASLASISSLAAAAVVITPAAAVLASTSALSGAAATVKAGAAALASTSTLTASTASVVNGAAVLASTSALTAAAAVVKAGTAALAATSALSAAASTVIPAAAALASVSTLTASTASVVNGTAALTSASTLPAAGATVRAGAAALASASTATAAAVRLVPAAAGMASVSALPAAGAVAVPALAVLASTSAMVALSGAINQPGRFTVTTAASQQTTTTAAAQLVPSAWP